MTQISPQDSGAGQRYVIGVDVGTGSARAGLFDLTGEMLASAKRDITLYRDGAFIAEQSSTEIWDAVCASVRESLAKSQVDPNHVVGLGFDATCSLVVLGENGTSLPVGNSEDPNRDIVVWMDHRAVDQAERINEMGHDVLKYVGGRISPEMETPKLVWLKENRPKIYANAWQFFDLADFLTWKATGDLSRSTCTVTCKWTYLAHEKRWDAGYFNQIGLDDIPADGFARIGTNMVEPGVALGTGLSQAAAEAMGLNVGTAVAAGMIDAHAGGIGTVGTGGDPSANLAYVFGTSSCTMTTTAEPVFVPGVWGPYYSAMVPGMWLNEGGQSAAGAAIDQLLTFHPAAGEAASKAEAAGKPLSAFMAEAAAAKLATVDDVVDLTKGIHVVPEFLGNRAPFADPHARAVIAGLGMERDFDSLIALYIAGLCGIGYGLRQIIETQSKAGANVDNVVISGGAGANPLVRQILADACGKPVLAPQAQEPVLLGSAILGAVAAGAFQDMRQAMEALSRTASVYQPRTGRVQQLHAARYDAFECLQETGRKLSSV